jgi:predicted ATPase
MNSGRWYEAELYRLKGDLLVNAPVSAIEACYERAIATAQSQGARLWELRATNALAALWRRHGRISDARHRLAPLYKSFPEEDMCVDLQKAGDLLFS